MRAVALALLVSCVPTYRVVKRTDPPLAIYLVDFFAAGIALGAAVDGYTRSNETQLSIGLGAYAGIMGSQAIGAP